MTLRGEGASGEELSELRGQASLLAEVASQGRDMAYRSVVDEMADEGAPVLQFRAAFRLGVGIEPTREALARAVARALAIAEPRSPEGVDCSSRQPTRPSDLIHSTRVRIALS